MPNINLVKNSLRTRNKNFRFLFVFVSLVVLFLFSHTGTAYASDRYWIGGTGNWSDTAHWSDSDGGGGGFSVPTSVDNVFFSAGSLSANGAVVTLDAIANTANLDFSGLTKTMTLTSSANSISIYGSITLSNKLTWTFTSTAYVYFKATSFVNFTLNGAIPTFNRLYMDGVGGKWTLQDDMNCGAINPWYFVNGEFDTNNKNVTAVSGDLSWQLGAGTKKLTLGSSIISLGNGVLFGATSDGNNSGLTVDAGTSTMKVTGDWFTGGTKTYNNIEINTTSRLMGGTVGGFTANNVSRTSGANTWANLPLSTNITINNTLTLTGSNANNNRLLVASSVIGTQRTITVTNVVASNVDFRDIKFQNAIDLSNITGLSGDAGGNSGITFTTAQPQYFKHTSGTVNWSDSSKWFSDISPRTTPGRVPLPQDDATFDASSFTGTSTLTVNVPRIGKSLNMSTVNQIVTLDVSNNIEVYGDFVLYPNVAIQTNGYKDINLYGRGNYNISTFNKSSNNLLRYTFNSIGGKYTFQSDFYFFEYFSLASGTLDFNDFNITGGIFGYFSNSSGTTLYMGNGIITLVRNYTNISGGWWINSGLTLYSEGSTIKYNVSNGATNIRFDGGNKIYNKVWFSGLDIGYMDITGSNTFNELIVDPGRKVRFTAGTTQQIGKLTAIGNVSNPITISSITGATHTLNYTGATNVVADYLNLSYSTGTPANKWYASHSTNGGNNSGWIFANAPDAPTGVTPTAGSAQVSLSWTAPVSDGGTAITDYVVEYKLTSDSVWSVFADAVSTLTTATVVGLTNSTSYDFRVSAVNAIGQGTASTTATATPFNPNDRYWIGGTGNWSDTAHWANYDGGAGGQSVPTSTNNVYFSPSSFSSNGAIVTLDVPASVGSLDSSTSDQTFTITSSVNSLSIYGNITEHNSNSRYNFTGTAYVYQKGSGVITTNGNTYHVWNRWYVDGNGITITNADDFDIGATLIYGNGVNGATWDTNNKTITTTGTFGSFQSILTLRNSTFNVRDWNFNGVLNAGTSTVIMKNGTITGGSTFYNLTINGNTYTGAANLYTPITVNNNLIISGLNSTNYRLLMASSTIGTQRTITVDPAKVTASNVDFRDIRFANAIDLSNITGLSGDAGGNSGITFTPAVPQYFKHTSGAVNWSDSTKWFSDASPRTTPGRVPLPQDDVIFDASSFTGASTLIVNTPRIGRSLDMSGVNQAVTMSLSNNIESYGSYVLGNNITPSGTSNLYLYGRSSFNFKTFNKTMDSAIELSGITGSTYNFLSDFTSSKGIFINSNTITTNHTGTVDFNDFNITCDRIYDGGYVTTYAGNGLFITTSLINGVQFAGTFYAEGSTFKLNPASGASNIIFNGASGGKIFNKIQLSGSHTGNFDISGNNTIAELIIDPGRKVRFTAGTTQQIGKLTAIGTALNPITISSITGATHTLNYTGATNVVTDYLNLSYSTGTPANKWYASHSTDGGNNSGWIFANAPDAPTGLTPTAGNAQVSLSWTAGANNGTAITDYVVEYKLTSEPTTWSIFSDGISTSTTSVVTGLINNSSYDFRVSAVNNVGQGVASATSTATPFNPNDRYWIGGTGNWSDTSHWANYDGGAGGQSVPISTNNVYFSPSSFSSNGAIVTLDVPANVGALDSSTSDQIFTITSSVNSLSIYGNITEHVNNSLYNFTGTAYVYIKGNSTITTNGRATHTWNKLYIDAPGSTIINADDFDVSVTDIILTNGTWNTNSKNIIVKSFDTIAGGTNTLTLGSSYFKCLNAFNNTKAGHTLNSGTSTLEVIGFFYSNTTQPFYNFQTNTDIHFYGGTFNNFTVISGPRSDDLQVSIYGNLKINGTLTLKGYSPKVRLRLDTPYGYSQSSYSKINSPNIIFENINIGYITNISGNNWNLTNIPGGAGDLGSNFNIDFPPTRTLYYKHTSGACDHYDVTKWYTQTNGGGSQATLIPLVHDNAIYDSNSFSGPSTLTINASGAVGNIDMANVNQLVTLNITSGYYARFYRNFIINSNVSFNNLNYSIFVIDGVNTLNLNLANATVKSVRFWGYGTVNLLGGFKTSDVQIQDSNRTTINFNSHTMELNGTSGTLWTNGTNTNINRGTSTIKLNPLSGSNNLSFAGGGKSFNKIQLSGNHTGNFDFTGSNTINELIVDPGRKVRFTAGTTQQIGKLTAIGNVSNPITISSITGATHTLNYTGATNVVADYLNLSYSTGTLANKWYASHSTDGGNNSGWIFANAPDAPTAVGASVGNAQVSLSWSAPGFNGGTAITDYTIEYKLTSEPTVWSTFSDGISTATTGIVTGLVNGSSYDFRIRAVNLIGQGTASTTATATPITVPDAPTAVLAIRGNAQATISFTPPVSNGGSPITSYTVTSNPGNQVATGSSSPIIVTGLTNGTEYTFTVTATNVAGVGSASTASAPVTPATIPDAPTTPIATAGNAQVSLSWTAPVWNGGTVITDYVIEYKLSSEPTIWSVFADGISNSTTSIVTGLTNALSYDFRIYAVNAVGQGSQSTETSAMPITVPDAPTSVSGVAGNAQVVVSFTPPVFNGGSTINNYTVKSSPGNFTATGNNSPITVTGLTNGTAYTFTVTAANAVGESIASIPSSPITPITVPDAPTAIVATEGNRQASISFTPPVFDGGTPITSYTAISSPGGFTGTSSDSPIVVTGLTNGTTYTFKVKATNVVGESAYSSNSNQVTLSTEPSAPVNLASTVLGSSIGLSWSAPVSNGGTAIIDYVVEYQLSTGGVWSVFADGSNTNTTAIITGLSNGSSYDFRVLAVNNIGQSIPSGTVSATPGEPAQVIINNFSSLVLPNIGTNIRITNEGSADYEYQYTWCVTTSAENLCGGGDDIWSSTAAKLINHGENWDTTLNSPLLVPGNYYFHVKVLYGSESSNAYQSFNAPATYPYAPTALHATSGNASALVSFNTPTFDGGSPITNYTVTSNGGGIVATGTSSPINVTGLTNGNTYTFTMTAENIVGSSPASAPSNSIVPATVPDAPTGIEAVAGNTKVDLSWLAPMNNGGSAITDYVIEYKISTDVLWSVFADGVSIETKATVTGLTNNVSYDFRVSAVNALGSSLVNIKNGTSPVKPPSSGGSGSYVPNYQQETIDTPNIPGINPIVENPIKNEVTKNTTLNTNNKNIKKTKNTEKPKTNNVVDTTKIETPSTEPEIKLNTNEIRVTPTEHPKTTEGETKTNTETPHTISTVYKVFMFLGFGLFVFWFIMFIRRRFNQ